MNTVSPILFLIFNRPNLTKRVWNAIRKARPKKLYIAADGPREDNQDDIKLCREARDEVANIDWPCNVERLYRDANLGCKKAVSEALDWFFDNVSQGIILEDDCLPDPTFFRFCDEILEKYKNNGNIGIISGNNLISIKAIPDSYYFSHYIHMWGWATWRRSWKNYDVKMNDWPEFKESNWLEKIFTDRREIYYWKNIFDKTYNGKVDTWDYQWVYSSWINNYINIVPKVNLVKNIGAGKNATHHTKGNSKYKLVLNHLAFPLKHPMLLETNTKMDLIESNHLYKPDFNFLSTLINYLKK